MPFSPARFWAAGSAFARGARARPGLPRPGCGRSVGVPGASSLRSGPPAAGRSASLRRSQIRFVCGPSA
eukprot:3110557-Lingulodinium_polyedra.AAC.1